jgi:hypothetical protein
MEMSIKRLWTISLSLTFLFAILPAKGGQEIKVDLKKNFVLNDGGTYTFNFTFDVSL